MIRKELLAAKREKQPKKFSVPSLLVKTHVSPDYCFALVARTRNFGRSGCSDPPRTSAGGAADACLARLSNCAAPTGLDTVLTFYPGLTPCRGPQRARFSRVGVDSATFLT